MWPFKKAKPKIEYRLYFRTDKGTVYAYHTRFYNLGELLEEAHLQLSLRDYLVSYSIDKKDI